MDVPGDDNKFNNITVSNSDVVPAINISGDDNAFSPIKLDNVNGTGIRVGPDAVGTNITGVDARGGNGTVIDVRGVNNTVSDVVVDDYAGGPLVDVPGDDNKFNNITVSNSDVVPDVSWFRDPTATKALCFMMAVTTARR